MPLGACRAWGWVRAGASRGANLGAGEAVWLAHTTSRQRQVAPRIAPALRVGPEWGRMRRCKDSPGEQPGCACASCLRPLSGLTRTPPKARPGRGAGQPFQAGEPHHGLSSVSAAHGQRRLQAGAHRRPLRPAKQAATQRRVQLHAGHAGRFALRHARNRRTDRRRGAARGAVGAAIHGGPHDRPARPSTTVSG